MCVFMFFLIKLNEYDCLNESLMEEFSIEQNCTFDL